ncbi:MAG: hypothetical protein GX535_06825 [Xanthomonadaceae bacterium]|nr:hypothetical protein [Xanthomonadaceae bacterium]
MNADADRYFMDETDVPALSTRLSQWYRAQSSVRRLRAIADRDALIVLVTIEPTVDGDDMLPVWLARQHDWRNELSSLASRDVRLELAVSGVFQQSGVDAGAVVITDLSWRDPSISP